MSPSSKAGFKMTDCLVTFVGRFRVYVAEFKSKQGQTDYKDKTTDGEITLTLG